MDHFKASPPSPTSSKEQVSDIEERKDVPVISQDDNDEFHHQSTDNKVLKRGLKARHSSMIAIGGGLGTGLIIGTSAPLYNAGPGSLFLAFCLVGLICWSVMISLGEMACFAPSQTGISGYGARYVDPAFGFAMGWNYLCKYLVVFGAQLNACALIISYWDTSTSAGVFITVFAIACLALNMLHVRVFGEVEFFLSGMKLLTIAGLLITNIVITAGGGPTGGPIGFRYWHENAFKPYKAQGSLGSFLGFWYCLGSALYAYIGTELVGVTAAETDNPRKTVKRSTMQTFIRILICYIGGVFTLGLVIGPSSPLLKAAVGTSVTSASASAFVAAIRQAGIPVLPAIVNACLLFFTGGAANSDLYILTRTLHSLAVQGQAPKWLRGGLTKQGVPWRTLLVTFPFFALAYINLAENGLTTFGYLSSTISVFGGLMWWAILFSHMRFMWACKLQGLSRDSLPYKSPLQPYLTYTSFFLINLIILTKGFTVFIGTFDYKSFITNYIGIPVFILLYIGWKVVHKTRFIPLREIDLSWAEVEELDRSQEEEEKRGI